MAAALSDEQIEKLINPKSDEIKYIFRESNNKTQNVAIKTLLESKEPTGFIYFLEYNPFIYKDILPGTQEPPNGGDAGEFLPIPDDGPNKADNYPAIKALENTYNRVVKNTPVGISDVRTVMDDFHVYSAEKFSMTTIYDLNQKYYTLYGETPFTTMIDLMELLQLCSLQFSARGRTEEQLRDEIYSGSTPFTPNEGDIVIAVFTLKNKSGENVFVFCVENWTYNQISTKNVNLIRKNILMYNVRDADNIISHNMRNIAEFIPCQWKKSGSKVPIATTKLSNKTYTFIDLYTGLPISKTMHNNQNELNITRALILSNINMVDENGKTIVIDNRLNQEHMIGMFAAAVMIGKYKFLTLVNLFMVSQIVNNKVKGKYESPIGKLKYILENSNDNTTNIRFTIIYKLLYLLSQNIQTDDIIDKEIAHLSTCKLNIDMVVNGINTGRNLMVVDKNKIMQHIKVLFACELESVRHTFDTQLKANIDKYLFIKSKYDNTIEGSFKIIYDYYYYCLQVFNLFKNYTSIQINVNLLNIIQRKIMIPILNIQHSTTITTKENLQEYIQQTTIDDIQKIIKFMFITIKDTYKLNIQNFTSLYSISVITKSQASLGQTPIVEPIRQSIRDIDYNNDYNTNFNDITDINLSEMDICIQSINHHYTYMFDTINPVNDEKLKEPLLLTDEQYRLVNMQDAPADLIPDVTRIIEESQQQITSQPATQEVSDEHEDMRYDTDIVENIWFIDSNDESYPYEYYNIFESMNEILDDNKKKGFVLHVTPPVIITCVYSISEVNTNLETCFTLLQQLFSDNPISDIDNILLALYNLNIIVNQYINYFYMRIIHTQEESYIVMFIDMITKMIAYLHSRLTYYTRYFQSKPGSTTIEINPLFKKIFDNCINPFFRNCIKHLTSIKDNIHEYQRSEMNILYGTDYDIDKSFEIYAKHITIILKTKLDITINSFINVDTFNKQQKIFKLDNTNLVNHIASMFCQGSGGGGGSRFTSIGRAVELGGSPGIDFDRGSPRERPLLSYVEQRLAQRPKTPIEGGSKNKNRLNKNYKIFHGGNPAALCEKIKQLILVINDKEIKNIDEIAPSITKLYKIYINNFDKHEDKDLNACLTTCYETITDMGFELPLRRIETDDITLGMLINDTRKQRLTYKNPLLFDTHYGHGLCIRIFGTTIYKLINNLEKGMLPLPTIYPYISEDIFNPTTFLIIYNIIKCLCLEFNSCILLHQYFMLVNVYLEEDYKTNLFGDFEEINTKLLNKMENGKLFSILWGLRLNISKESISEVPVKVEEGSVEEKEQSSETDVLATAQSGEALAPSAPISLVSESLPEVVPSSAQQAAITAKKIAETALDKTEATLEKIQKVPITKIDPKPRNLPKRFNASDSINPDVKPSTYSENDDNTTIDDVSTNISNNPSFSEDSIVSQDSSLTNSLNTTIEESTPTGSRTQSKEQVSEGSSFGGARTKHRPSSLKRFTSGRTKRRKSIKRKIIIEVKG
jgi:hypothetical protein